MSDGSASEVSQPVPRPLTLLAGQIDIPATRTAADRDSHVDRVCDRIDDCLRKEPAALVVLPELSTIDYSRDAFSRLDVLAETLDGPSCGRLQAVAARHDCMIVFGMPRVAESGFRISQVVVGPAGVVDHYDKIHTAQFGASMEKEYFERGERMTVFACGHLNAAPIICYDIRFPEMSRSLVVDHGVDLILHCGAYARDPSFDSWQSFVVTRAMENQIYMLSLNRAGGKFGSSMFCPPWVDGVSPMTVFPERDEAFLRFEVDSREIARVRSRYTWLADRLGYYGIEPDTDGPGLARSDQPALLHSGVDE